MGETRSRDTESSEGDDVRRISVTNVLAAGAAVVTILSGALAILHACTGSPNTERQKVVATESSTTSAVTPSSTVPATHTPSSPIAKNPRVLKQGTIAILDRSQASLTTGKVGTSVERPDLAYSNDFSGGLSASSGRIATILGEAATPSTCAERLARNSLSEVSSFGSEGRWLCLATADGHVAGVQVVSESSRKVDLQYVIWDEPVPPATSR
jgi:hypothetical protein